MTTNDDAVRLAGLVKSYGNVPAAAGVDLTVRRGETVALLGPNGAGKSTTISILLDLVRPDAGEVALFGVAPMAAVQAGRVGAMLQGGELPSYATVTELIELSRAIFPSPLPTEEILDIAGLAGLAGRRLDKLSGGERQRAKFGFALAGDPDLLVLDEPTAGMDAVARQRFWEAVRRRAATGRTVLFATHYLAEADEFADRVVVLSQGSVVADGTSADIRREVGARTVRFALGEWPSAGLDQLPGVQAVEIRDNRVLLTSDDADATVAALVRARGAVQDLEVGSAGITDAFLALTSDEES